MKKGAILLMFVFCILFTNGTVYAQGDQPKPLEDFYSEYGYESVEEAVEKFESSSHMNVTLPLRIPELEFTHVLGRFSDMGGEINEELDIEYLNEGKPENHYSIDIRALENKITINEKRIIKKVQLEEGKEAALIKVSPGVNVLVFETDQWQYRLSIDKRVSDKVPVDDLIKIANSIK